MINCKELQSSGEILSASQGQPHDAAWWAVIEASQTSIHPLREVERAWQPDQDLEYLEAVRLSFLIKTLDSLQTSTHEPFKSFSSVENVAKHFYQASAKRYEWHLSRSSKCPGCGIGLMSRGKSVLNGLAGRRVSLRVLHIALNAPRSYEINISYSHINAQMRRRILHVYGEMALLCEESI